MYIWAITVSVFSCYSLKRMQVNIFSTKTPMTSFNSEWLSINNRFIFSFLKHQIHSDEYRTTDPRDENNRWGSFKSKKYFQYFCEQDCGQEIDRLCSFLGISASAEEKERVITSVTFDSMKQNKMTNYSTVPVMNQEVSPFMRKGTTATFFSLYV